MLKTSATGSRMEDEDEEEGEAAVAAEERQVTGLRVGGVRDNPSRRSASEWVVIATAELGQGSEGRHKLTIGRACG